MCERKPWSSQEDNLLKELHYKNERSKQSEKLKWQEIAEMLNEKTEGNRSGKQCRERWHNQLDPEIEKDKKWSKQEEDILFRQQDKNGNKWALIAVQLPGRTDNNIKNYFYSTLRKAIRKINLYISLHKKQTRYKNVKQFKQQTLSKILTVADNKYLNKIKVKASDAETASKQIKNMLVEIQRSEDHEISEESNPYVEEVIQLIQDFNKNCKKMKGKKKESQIQQKNYQYLQEVQQEEEEIRNQEELRLKEKRWKKDVSISTDKHKDNNFKRSQTKTKTKEALKQPVQLNSKKQSERQSPLKESSSFLKISNPKISSSSHNHSSFRSYMQQSQNLSNGGQSESQQFQNIFQNFQGVDKTTNHLGFLNRVPRIQSINGIDSYEQPTFLQEPSFQNNISFMFNSANLTNPNPNPMNINMFENSVAYSPLPQFNLRSSNLEESVNLMKIPSRLDKNKSQKR